MNQDELLHRYSPRMTPELAGEKYFGKLKYVSENPQAVLDLHGKTLLEAIFDLEGFLRDSEGRGCTKVEVITGRGSNSPGNVPVLFIEIKKFLKKQGFHFKEGVGKFDVFFCPFS